MSFFRDLLSEDSKLSSLRVMGFVALFAGVGIAAYGLYMNRDLVGLSALTGVFVAAAFGGKVSQKILESKSDK